MKNKKINIILGDNLINRRASVLLTAGILLSSNFQLAIAAGNGSSPNGKPFVAIGEQIIEVNNAVTSIQDQIDTLVAKVDSMENRLTANETAIAQLQAENDTLQTLIDQNLTDITAIKARVTQLETDKTELEAQIQSNSGDIAALEAELAATNSLIDALNAAILAVQNGTIQLAQGLQQQINANTAMISSLQAQIASINQVLTLKQNLVNGVCPNGQAIQQVLQNGSVICENVSGGSATGLHSVHSYRFEYIAPYNSVYVTAYCPSGYTVSGNGYSSSTDLKIFANYSGSDSSYANYSLAAAYNPASYTQGFYSVATCIKLTP